MAAGDLAEVQVIFTNASSGQFAAECVFGFQDLGVGGTLVNLGTSFQTALIKNTSGGLLERVVTSLQCAEIRIVDVVPGTAATVIQTFTAVAGAIAGDALPPQDTYLFSWRTVLKGRSFRGRTFLPGVGESQQAAGVLAGACVTALNAVVTQMLAVYGPAGTNPNWTFVIISRIANGAVRNPPIGTQVSSGSAGTRVQSQRGRNSR